MHTPLHRAAALAMGGDAKVEAPRRPELGDLAAPCFALAKARGKSPAQVAQELAAAFQPNEWLESASAAGPYVNFRARRPAAFAWVVDAALGGTLLPRTLGTGKTITIDYGSPDKSQHPAYYPLPGPTTCPSLR